MVRLGTKSISNKTRAASVIVAIPEASSSAPGANAFTLAVVSKWPPVITYSFGETAPVMVIITDGIVVPVWLNNLTETSVRL